MSTLSRDLRVTNVYAGPTVTRMASIGREKLSWCQWIGLLLQKLSWRSQRLCYDRKVKYFKKKFIFRTNSGAETKRWDFFPLMIRSPSGRRRATFPPEMTTLVESSDSPSVMVTLAGCRHQGLRARQGSRPSWKLVLASPREEFRSSPYTCGNVRQEEPIKKHLNLSWSSVMLFLARFGVNSLPKKDLIAGWAQSLPDYRERQPAKFAKYPTNSRFVGGIEVGGRLGNYDSRESGWRSGRWIRCPSKNWWEKPWKRMANSGVPGTTIRRWNCWIWCRSNVLHILKQSYTSLVWHLLHR